MSAPEDERRPPGQEEAPRETEKTSPSGGSVAPEPAALNRTPASLRPVSYIAPRAESIPPELKSIDHWVAWRYELRADRKSGELKPTKVPIDPLTGANAKSNAKATWGTFEQAWHCYQRDGLDGVGFVVTLDIGIVGIDIDKCRDPETGRIDDEAFRIIQELNSYTEVSPSGCGIRIFARGTLPPRGRKKGRYELYDSGRFLTVTGADSEVAPW